MRNRSGILAASLALLIGAGGCEKALHGSSTAQDLPGGPYMEASFHSMTDSTFRITATAPGDRIGDYATCKAVWFAEARDVERISLGTPVYSESGGIPPGWVTISGTVYLEGEPNPDANPIITVDDLVPTCRQWDWYR